MPTLATAPLTIPNKLSIRTSSLPTDVLYTLPIAIISAVYAYAQRGEGISIPKPSICFEGSSPSIRTPIHIGVTAGQYIYAGGLIVGFYTLLDKGDSDASFLYMCKEFGSIPYYLPMHAQDARCAVAIDNPYHNDQVYFKVFKRLTTELDACTPITNYRGMNHE